MKRARDRSRRKKSSAGLLARAVRYFSAAGKRPRTSAYSGAARKGVRGMGGGLRWIGSIVRLGLGEHEPERRSMRAPAISSPRRIWLMASVLALGTVVVSVRAAELQLLDGARYGRVAERQATASAEIRAKRGVIKDRHGSELAITVDVESVFAEPARLADPADAARRLAPILGTDAKKLEPKLRSGRSFAYLKRKVDSATAQRVRALGLAGLGTHPEPKRFYSNVELAAHVLGFTSLEGEGVAGIERQLDPVLRGKRYEVPGLRDAMGKTVLSEGFVPHAVLEGSDVVLTLDQEIQHAAEEALAETAIRHQARGGVAVVLEANTGDVLALASHPSFNPNNLSGSGAHEQLNRAIGAVFEPGSTMKIVTVAGALEEGLLASDERIDCEGGKWRVGGRTIGDANHQYGLLSVAEVMKHSSNICAAKIGMRLGRDSLHGWLTKFGFGAPTEIELPGELKGLLRAPSTWREIALANIAFGQGLAATPLQIAQAASVIANDGLLIRPRIVRAIAGKEGTISESPRPAAARVLSAKTARAVAKMMVEVTKQGGTAETAAIPGFEVAGKTGTAQKIDPVTRAYSHELYVSSFVGFVPATRPEVVVLVLVDEPKGAIYGGAVAAPAFQKIATAALAAREVFPDDPEARERFLGSFRAAAVAEAEAKGQKATAPVASASDPPTLVLEDALSSEAQVLLGIDVPEAPSASPRLGGSEAPPAVAERGRMPDFMGLTLREVLHRSADVGCDPVVEGSGRVVHQVPGPGDVLNPGARCDLRLAPRG